MNQKQEMQQPAEHPPGAEALPCSDTAERISSIPCLAQRKALQDAPGGSDNQHPSRIIGEWFRFNGHGPLHNPFHPKPGLSGSGAAAACTASPPGKLHLPAVASRAQ